MATTKAANIENPNENLRIPSWITKEYFKEILANDEPGALYVKHFTPTAAIPPGENFTSIMLRIHVDLEMTGDFNTLAGKMKKKNRNVAGALFDRFRWFH